MSVDGVTASANKVTGKANFIGRGNVCIENWDIACFVLEWRDLARSP